MTYAPELGIELSKVKCTEYVREAAELLEELVSGTGGKERGSWSSENVTGVVNGHAGMYARGSFIGGSYLLILRW